MKRLFMLFLCLLSIGLVGCDFGPNSGSGFSLPKGDVDRGRSTFLELGCNACHRIGDIERVFTDGGPGISVRLGGPVGNIKTYGDLVTSIINPSHKISRRYKDEMVKTEDGQSTMLNYNDVMTVSELVDLVTFLETNYELIRYDRSNYPLYKP